MKKTIILSIPILFLFCGCGVKTNFLYAPGLEKENLSSRSAPATLGKESQDRLRKKGYLEIGNISSKEVIKTCWGDDCNAGFSCTRDLYRDLSKELTELAASKGGDLLILESNSEPSLQTTSKEGKCISWRETQVSEPYCCKYGNGYCESTCFRLVTRKRCADHEQIIGKECSFESFGRVWRHDPDLIKHLAETAQQEAKRRAEAARQDAERMAKAMEDRQARVAQSSKAIEAAMLKYKGDPYGLFPVEANGKWGYKNREGKMIVQPQFDSARAFYEGLARVTIGKKDGYIDMSGTIVIQPQFDYGGMFSGGLARVRVGEANKNNVGYIDVSGTIVIKPQFNLTNNFSEGLAFVGKDSSVLKVKWGCIDESGKLLIDYQFDDQGQFSQGLAAAASGPLFDGKRWGYINKKGEWLIHPSFYGARDFSDGLAPVSQGTIIDNKWGYINKEGQFVIKPQFADAMPFYEGLAAVKVGEKYGFIDKKGNFVIKPQFHEVNKFSNGWARVLINGRWKLINKSGKSFLDESIDVGRIIIY